MNNPTELTHFKGFIDSTLREGFQFSRADFSPAQQRRIFGHLRRIGADAVETGNPVQPAIRRMTAGLLRARRGRTPLIYSHVRNHGADIASAVACGVDGVNILCTVDAERIAAMRLTPEEYAARLDDNIAAAKAAGLAVRVGVEDFFGRDPAPALALYERAAARGADRIAAADTLGKTMGWEVYARIAELRARTAADIEVHFHNDLGQAVANALAAVRAGANWVSTSLLGIGERTGITPLSSFLASLYVLDPAAAARYNLAGLAQAERYVARICGIEVPIHLMTNPDNGFAHKAGIHLDALIKFGPHKYECLAPAVIGARRSLVLHPLLSGKTRPADVRAFNRRCAGAAR